MVPKQRAEWDRVSSGSHSPGFWVLGTAQGRREPDSPGAALQGLSGRPVVSQPCSLHTLHHTGLGVLSQSQEMDLLCGGGGAAALTAGVNPNLPLVHVAGEGGLALCIPPLAWPGLDWCLEERLR